MVCRALSHPDPRFPIWDRDRGLFRGRDPGIATRRASFRLILNLCLGSDETQVVVGNRALLQEPAGFLPVVAQAAMDDHYRDQPGPAAPSCDPAAEPDYSKALAWAAPSLG